MKRLITLFALILLASCNGNTATSSGSLSTTSNNSPSQSVHMPFMNNVFYKLQIVSTENATFSINTDLTHYKFNDRGFKAYGDDGRLISELDCYFFHNNTYYLDNNLRYTGTSSSEYTKFFVISDDLIVGELLSGDHDRFATITYANNNNIDVRTNNH